MKKTLLLAVSSILLNVNIWAGEGAGHVGGTDQPTSTVKEVRAAFDSVLNDIRTKKGTNHPFEVINIALQENNRHEDSKFFIQALKPYSQESEDASKRIKEINILLDQTDIDSGEWMELMEESLRLANVIKDYVDLAINKDKLYADDRFLFHDESPCLSLGADDNHSTRVARVTSFDITGRICISFEALTVIAPYDLKNHIMGVIIHETAHLAGMNEEDAERAEALYHAFSYEVYARPMMTSSQLEFQMSSIILNAISNLYYAKSSIDLNFERDTWKYNDEIIAKISTGSAMLRTTLLLLPVKNYPGSYAVSFNEHLEDFRNQLMKLTNKIDYQMQWIGDADHSEMKSISEEVARNLNELIMISKKCFPVLSDSFDQFIIK
ncbi:hypothetical protein [Bacteriovorax sp. Seq25_V]|uniref:hypothetical protein n=1 Tax=Bacteriovorax sp. Seq25_V TaxID=1201288 RepID=UPI00038A353E|nr:hypothetical protein [Bacteriovorax sp. Seq25_V]EQC47559.1 hypothetical protein M900_0935 [Bacteriovorax sp. Seq25_V]